MSSSMLWRLCFMNAYFLMRILVSLIRQSAIIFFIPDCKTVKNEQCIFPFTYKNQVYTGCTSRDHKQKKLWCSTKNKPDGNYETWDDCSPTCSNNEEPAKSILPASSKYIIIYIWSFTISMLLDLLYKSLFGSSVDTTKHSLNFISPFLY